MSERDPFDILRGHLHELGAQVTPPTEQESAALSRGIIAGEITSHTDVDPRMKPVRRRRRWILPVIVTGTLAAGGVAAARLLRVEHPREAVGGVVCRETLSLTSSAVQVPPVDDPLGACAAVWERGQLPIQRRSGTPAAAPPLIACVAPTGVVNVLPARNGETCGDLDLPVPDSTPLTADRMTQLQDRLSAEIDAHCIAPADARPKILRIMAEMGFESWTLTLNDDMHGPCTRTGLVGEERSVHMGSGPQPAPP